MGFVLVYAWFLTFWLFNIHALFTNNLGMYSAFLFYGIINLSGAIFALVFLPETKGRSEEEILNIIMKEKK